MDRDTQRIALTVDFWTTIKIGAGFWIGAGLSPFIAIALLVQLVIRSVVRLFHKSDQATP